MKKNIILGIGVAVVIVVMVLAALIFKSRAVAPASSGVIKEAEIAFEQGDYQESRNLYKKALEAEDDVNKLKQVQKRIEEINMKIIFSPATDKCGVKYVVKPSDTLAKIAKEHNTTVELIERANNLSSDVIRPGQQLKVNKCKFSILVDKSQNLLFLKTGDEIIKTYIVSTGKDNITPVGNFKIIVKQVNPTWFKPGAVIPAGSPENILGTRWLGLDKKDYGIHGTTDPKSLGRQVTAGCVRMKNEEVEELYDIVPQGTEVIIID